MSIVKTATIQIKFEAEDQSINQATAKINQKMVGAANEFKKHMADAMSGGQGGGSSSSMNNFFKTMNGMRTNQEQTARNHAKELMKLTKDLAKEENHRHKIMVDQQALSKNKNADLKEELRIKKELKNTEEHIARLRSQHGQASSSFDAARTAASGGTMPVYVINPNANAFWDGGGGGPGGGGGGGGRGGGRGKQPQSFWGGLGKSLGTAAALLATGAALIDQYTTLPLTRASSTGAATQSILGNQLDSLSKGDVVPAMAWQKERLKALDMARSKFNSQMLTSPMNVVGGAISLGKSAMGGGGGAGTDANANYLMGSITKSLGVFFEEFGKRTPLIGGMVETAGKQLAKTSEQYFSTHQAQLMEDFGKNYESMVSAQQKQNPLKNLAVEFLSGRYQSDLQSQRMMGLTDNQLYGRHGFLENANQAGFTGDMAQQQAAAIGQAGGSTRGMRGNSLLSLKAARGFDLTNASSILGSISGGAGSSEASERIFKRLLEEGVKNGLDKSESVEELRKFSQQTADIVSKTGAVTGEDAGRIMEAFSRFQNVGGGNIPTMRELEGANKAYQEYQGFSAETGGRGGAMQFAAMMKQGLGKIGPKAMGSLMEMPEEDLTTTNDRVVAIAARYGMSPKDLVDKTLAAKQEKADVEVGFDQKYRDVLKNAGITGKMTYEELQQQPEEVRQAYEEARMATSVRSKYETSQKAEAASLRFQRGGVMEGAPSAPGAPEGVTGRLEAAPGTRGADEIIASAGKAAQVFLENFRDFKNEITPTAQAVDGLTRSLILLSQVAASSNDKDRAAMLSGAAEQLAERARAQQVAKPSGGGAGAAGHR